MVGQLGGVWDDVAHFFRLDAILVAVKVTRSTAMTSHLLKMETDAIATSKMEKQTKSTTTVSWTIIFSKSNTTKKKKEREKRCMPISHKDFVLRECVRWEQ